MSKRSSRPSPEEPAKPSPPPIWVVLAHVLAGIGCVMAGSFIAQRADLGNSFALDTRGAEGPATAMKVESGGYTLRFVAPSGEIYRRRYHGGLGFTRETGYATDITVVYDPENPEEFRPKGQSYIPAAAAAVLFFTGMWCVLRVRRLIGRTRRQARALTKASRKKDPEDTGPKRRTD